MLETDQGGEGALQFDDGPRVQSRAQLVLSHLHHGFKLSLAPTCHPPVAQPKAQLQVLTHASFDLAEKLVVQGDSRQAIARVEVSGTSAGCSEVRAHKV